MRVTVKVGGRELALLFTVEAMDELEERLGAPVELTNLKETILEKLTNRKDLVGIMYILARAGERAKGREPDFDETWIKRNLKPGRQMEIHTRVIEALTEGMRTETGESGEDEEVDVVLDEIKKKPERS